MVKLEYVMGKELLRKALDTLLDALFKKRLVTGENLIGDAEGDDERTKLNAAMLEIDEWDEDAEPVERAIRCGRPLFLSFWLRATLSGGAT